MANDGTSANPHPPAERPNVVDCAQKAGAQLCFLGGGRQAVDGRQRRIQDIRAVDSTTKGSLRAVPLASPRVRKVF